jgi:hypothetical protein
MTDTITVTEARLLFDPPICRMTFARYVHAYGFIAVDECKGGKVPGGQPNKKLWHAERIREIAQAMNTIRKPPA